MQVFISYSHDSEEHKQWVLDLANRLRREGVDAWIDRYSPPPAEGWPRWMRTRIKEAEVVLVVCTETYCRRFEGREAPGSGMGVNYEGLIVSQILYEAGRNERFVPILPDGEPETSVPLDLRPYPKYRYPSEYAALQSRITGKPEVDPPPVATLSNRQAALDTQSEGMSSAGRIKFRTLVVEDNPAWSQTIREILERISPDTVVDVAKDFYAARRLVQTVRYDLTVLDVALGGEPGPFRPTDDLGFDVLGKLRQSPLNESCPVIILSGKPIHSFFPRFKVEFILDKNNFEDMPDERFLVVARSLIRSSRLAGSTSTRSCVTVTIDPGSLLRYKIVKSHSESHWSSAVPYDAEELARKTDDLVRRIMEIPTAEAHLELHELGRSFYERLANDEHLLDELFAKDIRFDQPSEVMLQFKGPASEMGPPFELLADKGNPWCLSCVLTRSLTLERHNSSKVPFARLVSRLGKDDGALRFLLAAGGGDPRGTADQEIEALAEAIRQDLKELDLAEPRIRLLPSAKSSAGLLNQMVREFQPHVLHYAGPGRHGSPLPQGIVLREGAGALSADELARIVERTELHLVVLNGCVGLHGPQGQGALPALFKALVQADVPAIVSHRWPVPHDTAYLFASTFYQELWRTFSPGDALLAARRALKAERPEEVAWASPILVLQNGQG